MSDVAMIPVTMRAVTLGTAQQSGGNFCVIFTNGSGEYELAESMKSFAIELMDEWCEGRDSEIFEATGIDEMPKYWHYDPESKALAKVPDDEIELMKEL